MEDNVNQPKHYIGDDGLEVLEVHANFLPRYMVYGALAVGYTFNVIKYILRAPMKNGIEDLKKAAFYLNHLIEEVQIQDDSIR